MSNSENVSISNENAPIENAAFDSDTYKAFAVAMKSATSTFTNKSVLWARASLVALSNGDINDLGVAQALYAAYKPMTHGKRAVASRSNSGKVSVAALRRIDGAGDSLVKNFDAVVMIYFAIGQYGPDIDKAIWAFITGEGKDGLYSVRDAIKKAESDKQKALINDDSEGDSEGEGEAVADNPNDTIARFAAYLATVDCSELTEQGQQALVEIAATVQTLTEQQLEIAKAA